MLHQVAKAKAEAEAAARKQAEINAAAKVRRCCLSVLFMLFFHIANAASGRKG